MNTPSTRDEFEKRMNYVLEMMKTGQMMSAMGPRGLDGLLNVRKLPNGRIDLLSIDESARLTANQMYQMRNIDFSDMLCDDKESK